MYKIYVLTIIFIKEHTIQAAMQIKDLQPRQGKVEITGTIIEKSDAREISSANFSGRVCNAKLQDTTGTIKLSLWNDQTTLVSVGDTIKISNGYVSEYQGEMQLSTGKFGKMELVSKGTAAPKQDQPEQPNDYADPDDFGSNEELVE